MGGTRGSLIVSYVVDVLLMSMVRGMRGVGGVCEMCMYLTRGGVGREEGEWMTGLGLGFTSLVGIGECWACVCIWVSVVWVV